MNRAGKGASERQFNLWLSRRIFPVARRLHGALEREGQIFPFNLPKIEPDRLRRGN